MILANSPQNLGRIEFWIEMWEYFGWQFDPFDLILPKTVSDFRWMIIRPQGITLKVFFDLYSANLPTKNCLANLSDVEISHEDRDSIKGTYAIRVRDSIKIDREWRNSPFGHNRKTISLTEQGILDFAFSLLNGNKCNIDYWTRCDGSRIQDFIPSCGRHDGDFSISWGGPNLAFDYLFGREVIS